MFLKTYRLLPAGFAALLFVAIFSTSAHANIPKKNISKSSSPNTSETYAATEEDPHSPTVIDTSEPGEANPHEEISAAPAMMPVPSATNFDPVPPTRVDSILKRVKLVETLLKKYGRAYDYRTVTTQDLEKILAQLESAT